MANRVYNCAVEATLDVIGGKWKPIILWWLLQGTCRFTELRRMISGISEKMLTQHLRELEEQGIVNRRVYSAVPPKVEYSLTTYGMTLKETLEALCDWGKIHMVKTGSEMHPEFSDASELVDESADND